MTYNLSLEGQIVKRKLMSKPKYSANNLSPLPNLAFSQRLKRVVDGRFSTQRLFAQAIGASESDVTGYLKHGVVPGWDRLLRVSEVLDVSIDYLLKGTSESATRVTELPPSLQQTITGGKALPDHLQAFLPTVVEFLQTVTDNEIRAQVIQQVEIWLRFYRVELPGLRQVRYTSSAPESDLPDPTE